MGTRSGKRQGLPLQSFPKLQNFVGLARLAGGLTDHSDPKANEIFSLFSPLSDGNNQPLILKLLLSNSRGN